MLPQAPDGKVDKPSFSAEQNANNDDGWNSEVKPAVDHPSGRKYQQQIRVDEHVAKLLALQYRRHGVLQGFHVRCLNR
jgi:hypothetical protein